MMGGVKAYHGRYGDKVGEMIVNMIRSSMEYYDLIATRRMYDSVYYVDGKVYIDVPYFSYMEYGTNPNPRVPIGKLVEWAMAKWGLDRREAFTVAYKVAKKIGMYGIAGRHFLEDALSDLFEIRVVAREGDTLVYKIVKRGW